MILTSMLGKLIVRRKYNKNSRSMIFYSLFIHSIKFRVVSPIDKKPMDGIPSIRVHHGLDFANSNHIIRWTEVFILKVRYLDQKSIFP